MAEDTATAKPAGDFESRPAAKPRKHPEEAMPDIAAQINTIARTAKLMEDKYYNLRKKVQINEENTLTQNKKMGDELKAIQENVLEMKSDIEDIKEKMRLIVRELKLTAKSEDVKVVEKYLDLWEPADFVTRNEARKMIERAVDEKFK